MKDNLFLIYSFDVKNNKWEKIPRFRSMMPFKNPSWFIKHRDVCDVCDWVEINILSNIEEIQYPTLEVLIRIATGMLNKCNVQKEAIIKLHQNLITNTYKIFYKSKSYELPFLGIVYWFRLYSLTAPTATRVTR